MRIPTDKRRWLAVALAGSSAVALAVVAPTTTADAVTRPHVLPSSKPAWTAQAAAAGTTSSATAVSFGVLLSMRNQAAAEAQVKALSTPGSASYGKWLNSAQFNASYAPSASNVKAVQSWLAKQGFAVTKTYQSGLLVQARGTVAQIDKTFGTTVKNYRYQGKTVRANSTNLSLPTGTPTAVVGAVSGIIGIDQGSALKTPADSAPPPSPGEYYGVQPCSDYYGQKTATAQPKGPDGKKEPYVVCGYTPQQLQSAYGEKLLLNAGVTGKGVTVAITDAYASPTIEKDLATYSAHYGLPQMKKGQFTQITPGANGYDLIDECGGSGWYGEETLDVDAVHSMAPGANIVYVGASDCSTGLDDAWASAIDNHVADIVTNSWTDGIDDISLLGTDYVDYYTTFALEAALTGITVNFSTGDNGDNTVGGTDLSAKTVEFPADVPYVTGVGGSSVLINKQGARTAEYGWQSSYYTLTKGAWTNETYSSGGGGGTSTLFGQPFYQQGVVPNSMSEYFGTTPMRTLPDISMDADPNTGLRVGQTQTFPNGTYYAEYRIGGTSLASPLMAGVLAVADQLVGHSLGFVNPLYYALSGTGAIHDTVAPKKPVYQVRTNLTDTANPNSARAYVLQHVDVQTTTSKDVKGYDTATGVGTPNGLAFFAGLTITGFSMVARP